MSKKTQTIEVFVSDDQYDALRLAAAEHDVSMGSIIRELISEWMEREPEK